MNIIEAQAIYQPELIERIRQTRLKGHRQLPIYENADITVETIDPDDVWPAQNYVLSPQLDIIDRLNTAMLHQLHTDVRMSEHGYLAVIDGYVDRVPIIPPIIELSTHADGSECYVIADGLHRVYMSRDDCERINCIVVRNIDPAWPYYAFPEPRQWGGVEVIESLEGITRMKKRYRDLDNYKALFRMYNNVFPGVQEQRVKSNPASVTA